MTSDERADLKRQLQGRRARVIRDRLFHLKRVLKDAYEYDEGRRDSLLTTLVDLLVDACHLEVEHRETAKASEGLPPDPLDLRWAAELALELFRLERPMAVESAREDDRPEPQAPDPAAS